MTTEKMRVSASSVISSVAEMRRDTDEVPRRRRVGTHAREVYHFGVRASRLMTAIRLAFVPAAVAWALALPLATFAASRAHMSSAGAAFVVAVYGIGSLICHQLPARSYHLGPCRCRSAARCTGIYFGAAIGAIAAIAAPLKRRPTIYGAAVGPTYSAAVGPTYGAAVGHRLSGANGPSRGSHRCGAADPAHPSL